MHTVRVAPPRVLLPLPRDDAPLSQPAPTRSPRPQDEGQALARLPQASGWPLVVLLRQLPSDGARAAVGLTQGSAHVAAAAGATLDSSRGQAGQGQENIQSRGPRPGRCAQTHMEQALPNSSCGRVALLRQLHPYSGARAAAPQQCPSDGTRAAASSARTAAAGATLDRSRGQAAGNRDHLRSRGPRPGRCARSQAEQALSSSPCGKRTLG